MGFDIDLLVRYAPILLSGFGITILICLLAGALAVVVGLFVALGLSQAPWPLL